MTSKDSFHEVAFNISFWTRNISSARILFWRGVYPKQLDTKCEMKEIMMKYLNYITVLLKYTNFCVH